MSPTLLGAAGVVALLVLMCLGLPISFCFFIVGFLGLWFLRGIGVAWSILEITPFQWSANFVMSSIPLFVAMGYFAFYSGISSELFESARKWVGHLRGGLLHATVLASTGFAAVTGASLASAAAMGAIALPEMEKQGYDRGIAAGCVAVGGTIAIMIPPSLGFIIYGLIAEVSIAKLFIAGIFPGLLQAVSYMLVIWLLLRFKPHIAPEAPRVPFKEMLVSIKGAGGMLVIFLVMMGGLYGGVFTPTEAGAVGALAALLLTLIRGRLNRESLVSSLLKSAQVTSMIFLIYIGAMTFSNFLALSGLPMGLARWAVGLEMPALGILAAILFVYLPLGCIMDGISMTVLTLPLFLPIIHSLGVDPILFGVLVVLMGEIGLITPPVGLNVFVIGNMSKIPLTDIFRGTVPFLIAALVNVVILVAFPQISLFLPNMAALK